MRVGRREVWTSPGASSVQERHRLWRLRVGRCGAHPKHVPHVCDAGRVPARDVGVEIAHAKEELIHACDCRDAPAGDGAVRRSGGSRVGIVGFDRRPQGGHVRKGVGWRRGRRSGRRIRRVGRRRGWRQRGWRQRRRRRWRRRACAQTAPLHTVLAVKRGVARPRTTDEELVRVGQPVRALRSRTGSMGGGWETGGHVQAARRKAPTVGTEGRERAERT